MQLHILTLTNNVYPLGANGNFMQPDLWPADVKRFCPISYYFWHKIFLFLDVHIRLKFEWFLNIEFKMIKSHKYKFDSHVPRQWNISKVKVTAPRSKVKSINKADVAHLWATISKHVQSEEASINRSRTRGWTKFPRSRSQHQGQRSNA